MRHVFITIAIILIPFIGLYSQDKNYSNSQIIERSIIGPGKVEFFSIGTFKKFDFEIRKFTNLKNDSIVKSLQISTSNAKVLMGTKRVIASLDTDEVLGMINFLEYCKKMRISKPISNTELWYKSRCHMQTNLIYDSKNWEYILIFMFGEPQDNTIMSFEDIDTFSTYLLKSIENL